MKKIGKLKKTGLAVTALSVSAALLAGGLACAVPYGTVAADEVAPRAATEETKLFDGINVPTEADYGKSFNIKNVDDATVKVTAPDGTDVTPATAGEDGYYAVETKQVGNYTVKYYVGEEKDGKAYSFTVKVSLDEDYFLKVDNNGATIPTRIKKGGTFKLPEAHIAYYDENKILRYYPGEVIWTIKDSLGGEQSLDGKTYTFGEDGDSITASNSGKLYITYSAQIEEGGAKFFSQSYTVNVQSEFEDKQAPTLTVSGITSNISVRRMVTLPTATVSDDHDENPYVEITVTDPNGNPVKTVDIDEYGYAYQDADKLKADEEELAKEKPDYSKLNYPEIAFDNKDITTFYPLIDGQYKVKYVARDDSGNVSSSKSWTMTAGDSVAPVFQEIDDWKLPEKWGVNVSNKDGALENKGIEIPIPLLVDNKDHMKANEVAEGEEEDKNLISLYVRITDSDYSRDILTFTNVLAKSETIKDSDGNDIPTGACVNFNSVYDGGERQVFSQYAETPFVFDVNKYDRKDKNGDKVDLNGTYTVYYRASDAAGNRSTKTYTIKIDSNYDDKNAPTIDSLTVPEYISTADTTLNIPSVVAKDAESSTIHTEYKIYSDGEYIDVKGGEKADIEQREDGLYLVLDKGKKELKLVDNMYFCVTATDAVGNVAVNAKDLEGAYYEGENYKKSSNVVKIIGKSEEKSYTYHGDDIAFKTATYGADNKVDGWTDGTILVGKKATAGGFTVDVAGDPSMRKYVGFEVSLVNADGKVLETTLETYTTYGETDDSAKIYVRNITFTPTEEGTHVLIVRVFDVNDNNTVYAYTFDVAKSTSGGSTIKPSAATILPDTTASINVKYTIPEVDDEFAGAVAGDTYYHARKISGYVYSLMGNEITAKSQGGYAITQGYVNENNVDRYSAIGESFEADGVNKGYSTFSVVDNEKPVIEVQGVMPTYAEKSTEEKPVEIEIPSIIAYSANGTAKVTIKVTQGTDEIKTEKVEGTNKYTFKGTKDGVYTISVTASRADAGSTTATYYVTVGDVIAPEFTVTSGTSGRKEQGSTFTFGKIKLVDEGEASSVTVTKKLYDPSGDEVSGATVNGSYNSYKDKTNNGTEIKLDKSGTYKVVYTAKDTNGNEEPYIEYITVTASGTSTPTTFTTLSTVLIVVAVVLLAGVIVYVVRFRKVKK